MAETPTSSSSSIALHHTVAKDRTTSVKTTEPELPTLLSEKLHIDQAKESSTCHLTKTPAPSDSITPPENEHIEDLQFNRVQIMQIDHRFSQETSAAQQMDVANPENDLLIQNGINPNYLLPAQPESSQAIVPQFQEEVLRVYAQNMRAQQRQQSMLRPIEPNQDSAVCRMPSRSDDGMPDMYSGTTGMRMYPDVQSHIAHNNAHNHALQDYHMQLMLLEQQNKQRLHIARMEQDNLCTVATDDSTLSGQSFIKSKI